MKKIFEDTNTLFALLIGIIGGLIWAINDNWNFEPVILLSISILGLFCFLGIKIIGENIRPIVEAELKQTGSNRGSIMMVPGVSPQNDEGFYLHKNDGIYHYEFEHSYDLVIRNNSINNAYNVKVFVENNYFLKFKSDNSSLEPLTLDKTKIVKVKYTFGKNLTTQQSLDELSIKFNDDLKRTLFIIEYHDENRKMYFTKFNAPMSNLVLKKQLKFDKNKFRQII